MTHTPSLPTARKRGTDPTGIDATTEPSFGSRRDSASRRSDTVTHSPPNAARIAAAPGGAAIVAATLFVFGSIFSSLPSDWADRTHTPPSPAATDDSSCRSLTASGMDATTLPVCGSIRVIVGCPHDPTHTASNPTSIARQTPPGTATDPSSFPVLPSSRPTRSRRQRPRPSHRQPRASPVGQGPRSRPPRRVRSAAPPAGRSWAMAPQSRWAAMASPRSTERPDAEGLAGPGVGPSPAQAATRTASAMDVEVAPRGAHPANWVTGTASSEFAVDHTAKPSVECLVAQGRTAARTLARRP